MIISCPQISSHAIKIPNYSLSLCLPLHNFPDMLSFSTLLSYDPFFHTRLKFNIRFKASLILLGNITCPLLYNPRIPQDLILSAPSWHLPGCVCSLGLLAAPVACENKIICVRQRSAAKMLSFVLLSGGGRWSAWSAGCVISGYLMAILLCG